MSANAYKIIDEIKLLPTDSIVEIGSERGGGSTAYLRQVAKDYNVPFYSVDIDPQVDDAIRSDGAALLKAFNGVIGFIYLDNYDYIFESIRNEPWVKKQKADYKKLGLVLNNTNSENAHLAQARLAHKCSRIGTVVVIDDTWYETDKWVGKGALAVPHLLNNGYSIIASGGREYKGYMALRRDV